MLRRGDFDFDGVLVVAGTSSSGEEFDRSLLFWGVARSAIAGIVEDREVRE